MLPLVVLCPVFSTSLATAGDEELYAHDRPLPLTELHPGQGQRSSGLLGLLKFALWQASSNLHACVCGMTWPVARRALPAPDSHQAVQLVICLSMTTTGMLTTSP